MAADSTKFSSFSDRTEYAPVGVCIYCGSTTGLTDEHTLASGMGGRHVLPKSSCISCRDIIAPVEQYCIRTLLHNARSFYGIQSHRKRPRLPTTVQVRKKSGEIIEVSGDPTGIPFVIALPVFPNPTILTDDTPPPDVFSGANWSPTPGNLAEFLKEHDAESLITKAIKPLLLARMVAKTAHAHAIAILGPGAFKPLLCDLILGRSEQFIDLVGGEIRPSENDYKLMKAQPLLSTFILQDWFRDNDGKCFLVAAVRFFGNIGAPTYYAVLGEPIPPRPPWRIKPEIAAKLGSPHTTFAPRVTVLPKRRP